MPSYLQLACAASLRHRCDTAFFAYHFESVRTQLTRMWKCKWMCLMAQAATVSLTLMVRTLLRTSLDHRLLRMHDLLELAALRGIGECVALLCTGLSGCRARRRLGKHVHVLLPLLRNLGPLQTPVTMGSTCQRASTHIVTGPARTLDLKGGKLTVSCQVCMIAVRACSVSEQESLQPCELAHCHSAAGAFFQVSDQLMERHVLDRKGHGRQL